MTLDAHHVEREGHLSNRRKYLPAGDALQNASWSVPLPPWSSVRLAVSVPCGVS
jgi:hypothetical protein